MYCRGLPGFDASGAVIPVHRYPNNIGSVGIWYRCVDIALAQGFTYITFLFTGDSWVPNGSLPELFRLVRESGADIGLSPFTISDERGSKIRRSQRFHLSNGPAAAVTTPRRFISDAAGRSGLFPLGPLQANIYRISAEHVIRFDETLPTRTDVAATCEFIIESEASVAIVASPFFQWREHGGRFHASMGVRQVIRDYLDTFHSACERTHMPVDYCRAKTRVLMNCVRLIAHEGSPRQWASLLTELFRCSRRSPYKGSSFFYMFSRHFGFTFLLCGEDYWNSAECNERPRPNEASR